MTLNEIKATLKGKTISRYDSFNSSHTIFVIDKIRRDGNSGIRVSGTNRWGKETSLCLTAPLLFTLITEGSHTIPTTIEGCNCPVKWALSA